MADNAEKELIHLHHRPRRRRQVRCPPYSSVVCVWGGWFRSHPTHLLNHSPLSFVRSTTSGRLIFELGGVDQRTLDRLTEQAEEAGRGSFKYAWILDDCKAERDRGVTIDGALAKVGWLGRSGLK